MDQRESPHIELDAAKQREIQYSGLRQNAHNNEQPTLNRLLNVQTRLVDTRAHPEFPPERPYSAEAPVFLQSSLFEGKSKWQRLRLCLTTPGISLKERVRGLPLIGYVFAIISHVIRLPLHRQQHELRLQTIESLRSQVEALNRTLNDRVAAIQPMLDQLTHNVVSNLELLERRIDELEEIQAHQRLRPLEHLDIGTRLMRLEQVETERKIKQFVQLMKISEKENTYFSAQIDALKHQIASIEKTGQQSLHFSPSLSESKLGAPPVLIDRFFKEFEEEFRGSREEIKQRLQVYLPYLHALPKDDGQLVIDVGCGRGEWLELLSQHQIPVLGVDLNAEKVAQCIEQGYAAKTVDAVTFLQRQEANSVRAVTGFHIVEHLPFEVLLELFRAAYVAIRPGGAVIFETPNPENLLVGACNFYFDPTHLHPIVPVVLEFMAKQAGFTKTEIVRLHPYPDDHLARGDTDADRLLNRYFFGAQDYALVAHK